MATRPLVQVQSLDGKDHGHVHLPDAMRTPIRVDIIHFVHNQMRLNTRQPHAVFAHAGAQTSAESWGTGRAVARIPRVPGGGTHRAGQGAFGNMCRKGRMFAPTKTYRKWHFRSNLNQRRYALCSALSATSVPALVMARGHRISKVPEIPLVISNSTLGDVSKTKQAIEILNKVHAYPDVEKVKNTRKIRAGKGKMRNRRYVNRKGPLLVYANKGTLFRAFRNLPGLEVRDVTNLNLVQLAPGGHVGRFVIWTKDAFEKLDWVFGTYDQPSGQKHGYRLPRSILSNPDIERIINSTEVQSRLRPIKKAIKLPNRKKNPLTNMEAMRKLNPFNVHQRRVQLRRQERIKAHPEKIREEKKAARKKLRERKKKWPKVKAL